MVSRARGEGVVRAEHLHLLSGWGRHQILAVANSWNKYWGENGYFRIKRGVKDSCGIRTRPSGRHNVKWKRGKPPDDE